VKELVIEKLALLKNKKPEYIEGLIAKKSIRDIKTLASELKTERTKMYRKVIKPLQEKFKTSKNRSSTPDSH